MWGTSEIPSIPILWSSSVFCRRNPSPSMRNLGVSCWVLSSFLFVFGPTVAIPCCDHAYFAILCLNSFLFFQDHVYSDNPALQYGDCHWTVLEREAQRLFPSTFQGQLSAFVGIGIESCLFRARTCYMRPLAHSLTLHVMIQFRGWVSLAELSCVLL